MAILLPGGLHLTYTMQGGMKGTTIPRENGNIPSPAKGRRKGKACASRKQSVTIGLLLLAEPEIGCQVAVRTCLVGNGFSAGFSGT